MDKYLKYESRWGFTVIYKNNEPIIRYATSSFLNDGISLKQTNNLKILKQHIKKYGLSGTLTQISTEELQEIKIKLL